MPEPASTAPFRPVALGLLTVVLIGLCVYLTLPFLPALAWAVALAIIAWPVHRWFDRHVPGRSLPAALSATLVAAVVVASVAFVTYQIGREATTAAGRAAERQSETAVRDSLAQRPDTAGVVEWMGRVGVNIDHEARRVVAAYTQDVSALLAGSLAGVVQFAVAMFLLFHLFRAPDRLLDGVRRLLPMTRAESDRVFRGFADSVHANLHATLVTSVIDGVGGGLMFWAVGLPSPVLWGVVMFFLSFLPILGTWLIWLPAVGYLALAGNWGGALLLLSWGVASWFVVDNVIYIRVAGDRMRLNQIPALLAFLGGLAVFGASGTVLGPAILAVTVAVLEVWHGRAAPEAAEAAVAEQHRPAEQRATGNGEAAGIAGAWVGP